MANGNIVSKMNSELRYKTADKSNLRPPSNIVDILSQVMSGKKLVLNK